MIGFNMPTIRPMTIADHETVLLLNEQSVHFLSPLSGERLAELQAQSALHIVAEQNGAVAAFLLALREGAGYDSVNYQWFAQRYPQFLYIDRVVVSAGSRSSGLGKRLYQYAFAYAADAEVARVVCEIDAQPPNPVSAQFHRKFGFKEVGRQSISGGAKIVSLQLANVWI
jgi:predicted GNAT superfamily acetyltransferase